jgi:hypothetical protein
MTAIAVRKKSQTRTVLVSGKAQNGRDVLVKKGEVGGLVRGGGMVILGCVGRVASE